MAKSKEELIYDIENELVDPTTNKVTGERVKARLLDMVDSMGQGGGGGGQWEYWEIPEGALDGDTSYLIAFAALFRLTGATGESFIVPSGYGMPIISYVEPNAIALDTSVVISVEGLTGTLGDLLYADLGGDFSAIGFEPISKEQFYDI